MQQPSKRNRTGCAAVSVDVEFSVVVVNSAHYLQGLKFGLFFMLRSQRKLRYCLTEEPLFTVNKIDTFRMAQTCYHILASVTGGIILPGLQSFLHCKKTVISQLGTK